MKEVVFVINPHAGTGRVKKAIRLIEFLEPSGFSPTILLTNAPGDAVSMACEAVARGADRVVVCGGDGTVNEVVGKLAGSSVKLGIIPVGSGNGFARSLGLPMGLSEALTVALGNGERLVDVMRCNDRILAGLAGIGFDATVARKFDASAKRGLWEYVRIVLSEFRLRQSLSCRITTEDGTELKAEALMVNVCNTGQFGNNAYISPASKPDDGLLELVITRPVRWFEVVGFAWRIFRKTVHKSPLIEVLRGSRFIVNTNQSVMHMDGEPVAFDGSASFKVMPGSLRVVVP